MDQLKKWGFTHQAITDHGNLFGAVEFYRACESSGITPIVGCELYVASGSRLDKGPAKDEENPQKSGINHLTVLARNNEGYQNLIELVTRASLEGFYYKPRVDKELLAQYSQGLMALSGCLKGEVAQAIMSGKEDLAVSRAMKLAEIFGPGNFYLEVMDHGLEAQQNVAKTLFDIAKKTNLPMVATNDCHYFKKEEAQAHDALLCIGTGKKVTDAARMRYASQEFYYKSPEEMAKVFGQYPELMSNTLKVAEAAGGLKMSFNELHLPDYHVPGGYSQESYLEHLCRLGMKERFPAGAPQRYQDRLVYELGIIKKMGFPGYFLIVWDFIHFAKRSGIPVGPGRGSGAGSLVSYLLRITSVDPIQYGLLFERFLNPDRRSMPDLDIDFSDEGRDVVIGYVRDKYGFTNVAQIITFGTMQSRAVIRDVGRVLDVPLPEVDRIAKSIPHGLTIDQASKSSPDFRRILEESASAQKILPLALKLEGVRRHAGVHAAGTVITKEPVTKYAPLYKNNTSGIITTGFNDESLVNLGLLKVDFLGLRTLTVIQQTVELIERHRKIQVGIESIAYDDPKTYELLARAQTGGVFQLESRGMRDLLIKLKPTKLTDIIALVALFRPGPMKWIDEFCARKHGAVAVSYGHPVLEGILKETYGICVYQEQVMEIAKQLAGFTAGEADKLRKAMGKKIPEELDKMQAKFVEGAKARKVDGAFVEKLYEDLKDFGHYAFNKSHSTAYGIVAYQTAYLKANYPVEFMTALINSEIGRTAVGSEDKENKIATYLDEARLMGFATLAPSINHSEEKFSIESAGRKIRFGLLAIKNVGEASARAIVEERKKNGPYGDIENMFQRVAREHLNRKVFESFAKAGALDDNLAGQSVSAKRAQFLQDLDHLIEHYANPQGEMLFDLGMTLPQRPPVDPKEEDVLVWEKEVLGVYLTFHPLDGWRDVLGAVKTATITDLRNLREGAPVHLLGLISSVKKLVSKKSGQAWARLRLEDLSGVAEVVLFPRLYAAVKPEILRQGAVVCVSGRVSSALSGDEASGLDAGGAGTQEILADEISFAEDFLGSRIARLDLALGDAGEEKLLSVKNILETAPGGESAVCLVARHSDAAGPGDVLVEYPKRIQVNRETVTRLGGALERNSIILVPKHNKNGHTSRRDF